MDLAPRPLVLHTEASRGLGGQELRILTEARWLLAHGWGVLVACPPDARLRQEAARAAVPVEPVAMRGPADLPAVLRLRRLMRGRAVAVVHTHSSVDSWLAGVAGRTLGLPVVRSRHVAIPIKRRRALVYRLAARVLTSGEAIAAIVRAAGVAPERIVAIPAGVDLSRFHPGVSGRGVRDELGLGEASTVGLVANIRGSKGHECFLEAARLVLQEAPETRFLVVGDGVGFADVRRRVLALGLDGPVQMTGFRHDVPEIMAALDVLVLPSVRSEATSQVIPQALAVGTPVVATAVGGIPEIVRDGETGLLVSPGDAPALARAILALLRDPARGAALARTGQALVRERYTLDAMMEATTGVYRTLLAARARRRPRW